MEVPGFWLMLLCFISTVTISYTSVNMSRNPTVKNTRQSTTYNRATSSNKAVDGCTKQSLSSGCCSYTALGLKMAVWQINLQGLVVMESVQIYYRDEDNTQKKRFGGYQIYLSNTTDWMKGYRCHIDTTATRDGMDLIPSIMCKGTVQYLTVYIDRNRPAKYSWYSVNAVMELCEVEVYGCPFGKYGDSNCLSNCDTSCVEGLCDPTTGRCAYCAVGFYKDGAVCKRCPTNCLNGACDVQTGICSDCVGGFYKDGAVCKRCPANCLNGTCDVQTGICSACEDGYYGSFCAPCPTACTDPVCDQTYGNCSECQPGYYDTKCDMECPSNCTTCHQISGLCTACLHGLFSTDCEKSCHMNCKGALCDISNGQCTDCEAGSFGRHCNMSCSSHCTSDGCKQNTGDCLACTTGYYGLDCEQRCGQCHGSSCSMTKGSCNCIHGWGGEQCNTRIASTTPGEQTGVYAGAGVGGTIVVALVAIVVIIILRRKRLPPFTAKSTGPSAESRDNVETTTDMLSKRTYDEPTQETNSKVAAANECERVYVNLHDIGLAHDEEVVYNNVQVTSVPVNELRAIIDSKMADDAAAFKEEFKTFPWGALHPHEEGKKASNKVKNRFKTTFPYDHSRVILETLDNDIDTSYTNANFIDSVDTSQVYVASQGPKPNTLDDFWRMIWHVNSGKVVMLTNLKEGTKIKCQQYWPEEGEPLATETFDLKLDRERIYACYIIRDISIVHKKTKEERQVHQFHFTTWPDHGTPDTLELALFHRCVTLYETQLTGQMVVHCSAGIGRTGTFIALDALLTQGKHTGHIDISSYIGIMRKDRMNMIQTYEQYIALHELLVEGFTLHDSYISRLKFHAVLETLFSDGRPANFTQLYQEFERLQTFNPNYSSSCFASALLKENVHKNRDIDILAADRFRAYLQSQQPNRTNYINAVIIQSHTSRFGYLMTQFPLEDTVDDFWTMVFDHSCDNMVVIGIPPEDHWLRDDRQSTKGVFFVTKLNARSTNYDVDIADYKVTNEQTSSERTVQIFTMKQWSSDSLVPPSDSSLLLLLEQLDSRRRSDNTKPVVVMCRNGCTQSGLFCCISNVRDQMKMDDGVDIFQTARQLKSRRPEALSDMKQYQYCYTILGQYLDSTNVYIN